MAIPNLQQLEIHVTYRCNLRCLHCSNLITQAPSNEDMPVERIDWLLEDSVKLNYPWKWLVLHGGEPTMHPEFERICEKLVQYRSAHNRDVKLFLCTNGHGEHVQNKIHSAQQLGISIENSHKSGQNAISYHVALSSSPSDNGEPSMLGCFQTERCGIAFNNLGFFECSPAASMARLFGYKPMETSLSELSVECLSKGFETHCRHCGYSRLSGNHSPDSPMSKTWIDAIELYKLRENS